MGSIETLRPKPASMSQRALAIVDKATAPVVLAIETAQDCRRLWFDCGAPFVAPRDPRYLPTARQVLDVFLPMTPAVQEAERALREALVQRLDPPMALAMLTALYQGLGKKPGDVAEGLIAACVDMLAGASDHIGAVTGLWRPTRATPVVLALAVRKLVLAAEFPNALPAEVRRACREVRQELGYLLGALQSHLHVVERARALMIACAPDEWQQRLSAAARDDDDA